jgi:endonuclease/exonuclease/phosphatase family metal-dependent hydrolase
MRIRVATYNIHRCVGGDGRYDAGRIIDVLRELDCDIVALQEVANRADARHVSLQLDHIAESVGMRAIPGLQLIRRWGEYGNALLTRFPVLTIALHNLSVTTREPRGAIDVHLDIGGRSLRVIATHLGLGRSERHRQTRQLLTLLGERADAEPCLVLGDMNEWLPWSRPLQWLHRELGAAPAPASFPARLPFLKLDRIWLRPRAALQSVQVHRSPLARLASDHLPVSAWMALPLAIDSPPAHP